MASTMEAMCFTSCLEHWGRGRCESRTTKEARGATKVWGKLARDKLGYQLENFTENRSLPAV
jgi:hypothetical protein